MILPGIITCHGLIPLELAGKTFTMCPEELCQHPIFFCQRNKCPNSTRSGLPRICGLGIAFIAWFPVSKSEYVELFSSENIIDTSKQQLRLHLSKDGFIITTL